MASRPTSAFVFSLIGGSIILVAALITINSWFALDSELGPGFEYNSLGLGSVPSAEAIALFVIGAFCGILIFVGAVLLYSGDKSKVRWGSMLVLVASVASIPSTFFGMFIGGLLSVVGVALGLSWKPEVKVRD